MSERPQRKEMTRKQKKKKNRAKQVSGLVSTRIRGSPQHLCLRKKQRESPHVPTLINKKAPAPKEDISLSIPHHFNTRSCPSNPSCTPVLLLPSGGERLCPSPPARYSCTVRGSVLTVIIYEREEGKLSRDFHMNKDQHSTILSFSVSASFLMFVSHACS